MSWQNSDAFSIVKERRIAAAYVSISVGKERCPLRLARLARGKSLSSAARCCENDSMRPEFSLRSELDEPIDAIVEDVRPAQPTTTVAAARSGEIYRLPALFQFEQPTPAQYVVPRRFGMSAILGIMTALAVLFGSFRLYGVDPVLYLFFGFQALVICLAQMLYGKTPRAASAIVGAVLLPMFLLAVAAYSDSRQSTVAPCAALASIPLGAFLGYVTGTLAAGVFLIMDSAERLLSASGRASR